MSTVQPHKLTAQQIYRQAKNPNTPILYWLHIARMLRRQISRVQFPYTLYCGMLLFSILLCVVLGFLFVSRDLAAEPSYPLADFEGIKAGHPDTLLTEYECHSNTTATYGETQSCEITPDDPMIQHIQVTTTDRTIQSVLFFLNGLPLGYLSLRWGNPKYVRVHEDFFVAKWESGLYARGRLSGNFSYNAPVYILSLAG